MITENLAIKYFGRTDVVGEVITFDNEFDYSVSAVIVDPPQNSHFNSFIIDDGSLGIIAPLLALNKMRDWDMAGNWGNLSLGNMTYVLIPPSLDEAWLQTQIDSVYESADPDGKRRSS